MWVLGFRRMGLLFAVAGRESQLSEHNTEKSEKLLIMVLNPFNQSNVLYIFVIFVWENTTTVILLSEPDMLPLFSIHQS